MTTPDLDVLLGIDYPILVAPMFLISNTRMIKAALDSGVTAAFPALNYRTDIELRAAIADIKSHSRKPFGVNLIVNRSNPKYKHQLETLLELRVDYIITSLGNPRDVIEKCRPLGIKVFCDVIDLSYAKKVEGLGADALIAVNSRAGGHAGNLPPRELIELLKNHCRIPVISAGGIGKGAELAQVMSWGASGASIGTIFIACEESEISPEYKQAMIQYGEKDIVKTDRLSGSPLTVINTPYVRRLGTRANWLERILLRNKMLKKYAKMLIALRGMRAVEKAAFGATYKTVWCAGPAIEHVKEVLPMKDILKVLIHEYKEAKVLVPRSYHARCMKAASLNDIRKQLANLDDAALAELCLTLVRFKKDNKELLTYLLFEAQDEQAYINSIKAEVDDLFEEVPKANVYFVKKSIRKILRVLNKQIRYSGLPLTELEARIHFCLRMKSANIPLHAGTVLFNLYQQQLKKIISLLARLPEDLRFDYDRDIRQITKD